MWVSLCLLLLGESTLLQLLRTSVCRFEFVEGGELTTYVEQDAAADRRLGIRSTDIVAVRRAWPSTPMANDLYRERYVMALDPTHSKAVIGA